MSVTEIESWGENRTYFWSLDENGQSEMTEEECSQWMVPKLVTKVDFLFEPKVRTWPSYVYTAIRDWQVARGFDPTTADFARSLGHPELDILIDNETMGSRFEEVHETSSSGSSTPETWSNQSTPEHLDIPLPAEVAIPQPSQFTVPPKYSKMKAQPRAESPQMQPMMVDSSDPVSILGKRQRGSEIQTRSTRQRVSLFLYA
ncbi:hypothetical protein VNI00_014456 [Paramarasmius palmivorus]|uniref:Uncharacterized protein n=1 Tax=Paramarasmius palmivorus TaxID=297713 RepID=A0AAW0BSS2_9AGAR